MYLLIDAIKIISFRILKDWICKVSSHKHIRIISSIMGFLSFKINVTEFIVFLNNSNRNVIYKVQISYYIFLHHRLKYKLKFRGKYSNVLSFGIWLY